MDQNAKPGAESLACAAAEIQAPKIDRTVVFSLFWLDFEYLSVCAVQVCIHTVYIYIHVIGIARMSYIYIILELSRAIYNMCKYTDR
jgi:hypothetical protein